MLRKSFKTLLIAFIVIASFIWSSPTSSKAALTTGEGLNFGWGQTVRMNNINVNQTAGAKNTVEFWMYWDGNTINAMPITFESGDYDLAFTSHGYFGFNTINGDMVGFLSSTLKNTWVHVAAVFFNGAPYPNNVKIYINGQQQVLSNVPAPGGYNPVSRTVSRDLRISGYSDGYYFAGKLRDVAVWNHERNATEVQQTYSNGIIGNESGLVGLWKFDDFTTKTVIDQSPYDNHGVATGFAPPSFSGVNVSNGVELSMANNSYPKKIYKDGALLTQTTSDKYVDTNVLMGSLYKYEYEVVTPNGLSNRSELTITSNTGKERASLNFNGSNNYFTLPNSSAINFGANDFTIEMKAKIDSIPNVRAQLLSKRVADNQYIELQVAPNGVVEFEFGQAGYGLHLTTPTNTAKLGVYHHYSMVRQGTSLKLYVDGVESANATITGTVNISNSSDWYIGSDIPGFNEYLNGNISEIRFWNRARTSTEIQQNFNTTFVAGESNLVGLWRLTKFTTGVVYDRSGSGNDGTGYNFAPPLFSYYDHPTGVDLWFEEARDYIKEIYRDGVYLGNSGATINYFDTIPYGNYNYQHRVLTPDGESIMSSVQSVTHNSPNVNMGTSLDGGNDYFTIPNSNALNFSSNDFTIEAWVKPSSGKTQQIFVKRNTSDVGNNNSPSIELQIQPDLSVWWGLSDPTNGLFANYSTNKLNENQFHHIALVRKFSTIYLYIDGVYEHSVTIPAQLNANNSASVLVGKDVDVNQPEYLQGALSELRIWTKAKTQSEIQQNLITDFVGNETGLVGLWKFDSLTTAVVYDQSVNDNHASGYGFPPPTTLTSSDVSDLGLTVNWMQVGLISGYELRRDGVLVYETSDLNFKDNSLMSDTSYWYSVVAKNKNGKSAPATARFKTKVGELSLLSYPSSFSLSPTSIALNGDSQKIYGTTTERIIVKDTRKVRDGWRLQVKASQPFSTNGKTISKSVGLKPIQAISKSAGQTSSFQPIKATSSVVSIDGSSAVTLLSADSNTGYGIYEITLPSEALEVAIPAGAYNGNYSTNLTWSVIPGK